MNQSNHCIHLSDARAMSDVPDGSVQLIVTSPSYWQFKDYRVALEACQVGFHDSYEDQ